MFKKGGYVFTWPGVIVPDRHEKLQIFGFLLNNLSLNEWISLKVLNIGGGGKV